jgi:hypothetical protein
MIVESKNQMSVESTRATVAASMGGGTHDVSWLDEEVVFTVMPDACATAPTRRTP